MKNKYLYLSIAVFVFAFLAGCKKSEIGGNVVYLANAGDGGVSQSVTVDDHGGEMDITARTAEIVNSTVTVSFGTEAEALNSFNQKWGTNYKLLPESYYSLTTSSVEIKSGSAFALPVQLNIKPLDAALPESDKYAIPITITSTAGGLNLLNSAKTVIVIINRVIITDAPRLSNAFMVKSPLNSPYNDLKAWTFEWRCNMSSMSSNNRALMMAYGNNTEFYTRFGDVVIKPSQLQVKFGSYGQFSPEQEFQANKWYHFAVVYDGSTAKWYADGKEIMNVPLVASFNFDQVQFGNNNTSGLVNEIRFWSVPRSQAQIINNMYAVDPASPGLEGYWKCNEGSGKTFKDATANGNDMEGTGTINWVSGVRMPAE